MCSRNIDGHDGRAADFNGSAGAGALVKYGDDSNDCGLIKLQFDAGRATSVRLAQVGVPPNQLNVIFFTHMHSDHTEGFGDLLQLRWFFNSAGPKLDVVCSSDTAKPLGFTISCQRWVAHISDAFMESGEIAQRRAEDKEDYREAVESGGFSGNTIVGKDLASLRLPTKQ